MINYEYMKSLNIDDLAEFLKYILLSYEFYRTHMSPTQNYKERLKLFEKMVERYDEKSYYKEPKISEFLMRICDGKTMYEHLHNFTEREWASMLSLLSVSSRTRDSIAINVLDSVNWLRHNRCGKCEFEWLREKFGK